MFDRTCEHVLRTSPKRQAMAIRSLAKKNGVRIPKDDLYQSMRILLCFGRIIGFVPICGLFQRDLRLVHPAYKWSVARTFAVFILVSLLIHAALYTFGFFNVGPRDTIEIVRDASSVVFTGIGLYVCIFMYLYSDRLLECFDHWRQLSLTFYYEDTNLALHVNLIAGLIFTSGILENACSHWKVLVIHGNATLPWEETAQGSPSIWATYWWTTHYTRFTHFIPYNVFISMSLFIFNKWCVYAWTFGDILISVLARALYKRFQLHYQAAKLAMEMHTLQMKEREKGEISLPHLPIHSTSTYILFWKDLVRDHDKLTDLFKHFSDLLSPLIFCSAFANIYFVGTTLYNILESTSSSTTITFAAENQNEKSSRNFGGFYFEGVELSNYLLWHRVYVAWAFLHLFIRMMTTFVCGAKVNDYIHKTVELLERCPVVCWTKEVERMNLKLKTTTIGLTGLGFFTITKPFILSVFNVIFTVEIVLLQSSNMS